MYKRAFNENIFDIRKHYRTVFPEPEFEEIQESKKNEPQKVLFFKDFDSSKVYKIKYTVNMLPFIGKYLHKQTNPYTKEETREMANTDVNFLALCCESEDLDIF